MSQAQPPPPPSLDRLHDMIPHRVREILLVSSLYDSFILGEDLQLTEQLFHSYLDMGLSYPPRVTRAANATDALRMLGERPFDLVLTTLRLGTMAPWAFAAEVKRRQPSLPVILLSHHATGLVGGEPQRSDAIDRIFIWAGDSGILLAIVKYVEDRLNVAHDTRVGGVRVLLIVENSPRYYSALLPVVYGEIVRHTVSLVSDAFNSAERRLRMRARPKVLLADTYEEALALYREHAPYVIGVLSDVRFSRDGRVDPDAGLRLAEEVHRADPAVPVLLQSSEPENEARARAVGIPFFRKDSPTLLQDLRVFLRTYLGFGEFVFRTPQGQLVARASTPAELMSAAQTVPEESLAFHARQHHFSNWLMARGEVELAQALRARSWDEFPSGGTARAFLVETIRTRAEAVAPEPADEMGGPALPPGRFLRVGGGSMGGKGRGVAFVGSLLSGEVSRRFPGVVLRVPRTLVLGTDAFDGFLDRNRLRGMARNAASGEELQAAFAEGSFPEATVAELERFLGTVHQPLAVRSSSLLEDSQELPMAGLYATYLLPNNNPDLAVRVRELCRAVTLVYASTYGSRVSRYLGATRFRIEEERMAVLVQRLVGRQHGRYCYPDISGVAQSYNVYPFGPATATDGIATVALGLGKAVVEGEDALRFCPRYPEVVPQLDTPDLALRSTQRQFWALDLGRGLVPGREDANLERLPLATAEEHGTLDAVGSTFAAEDGRLRDGLMHPGPRVVSFAGVLRLGRMPLAEVLRDVLRLGEDGMGCPVEMEFAVTLPPPGTDAPAEFAALQLRPLSVGDLSVPVSVEVASGDDLLCAAGRALGHGVLHARDVVFVDPERFDRGNARVLVEPLARLNAALVAQGRPYLLVGPGRWGSSDASLGVPVGWEQIAGACAIVETPMPGTPVEPSSGSHFLHNLTARRVPYLTVLPGADEGFLDWAWLLARPTTETHGPLRHVRLARPVEIRVDGRAARGVVLKGTPGSPTSSPGRASRRRPS